MKVRCNHCSKTTDVTFDSLIFENEDEETFVRYLSSELTQLQKENHLHVEDRNSKSNHTPEERKVEYKSPVN